MSKLTKISVLANGKVLAHTDDGNVKLASETDIVMHFASKLPKTFKGAEIDSVAYDNGYIYGKYANNKMVRKQVIAIAPANQTEAIDTVQKNVKVPRNESKAKPKIDVGDDSVKNPTEVRSQEYGLGKKRIDNLPKASGDGAGGKATDFAKIDVPKSGNPDTYVQKLNKNVEPSKAGSEANRTATSDIQIVSNGSMYQNLKLSEKEDKDKCPDCKKTPCTCDENKDECCDEKEEAIVAKEATTDNTHEVEALKQEVETLKEALKEAKTALAKKEVVEKRFKAATKYALAMQELNPVKYASSDSIVDLVEKTANTMSKELIENATENAHTLRQEIEAASNSRVVTAGVARLNEVESDGNLATAIVVQSSDNNDDMSLKEMLMSETRLGRDFLTNFDGYKPHEKE